MAFNYFKWPKINGGGVIGWSPHITIHFWSPSSNEKTVPLKRRFNRLRLENSLQIVTPERPLGDVELPRWVSWRSEVTKWCRAVEVSGRMYDRRKIQSPSYVKHLQIYIYICDLYIFIECMFLFHAWLFVFVHLHFVFIDVAIGVWINQNYAMPLWETTDGSHERFPVLVVFPHHPATWG